MSLLNFSGDTLDKRKTWQFSHMSEEWNAVCTSKWAVRSEKWEAGYKYSRTFSFGYFAGGNWKVIFGQDAEKYYWYFKNGFYTNFLFHIIPPSGYPNVNCTWRKQLESEWLERSFTCFFDGYQHKKRLSLLGIQTYWAAFILPVKSLKRTVQREVPILPRVLTFQNLASFWIGGKNIWKLVTINCTLSTVCSHNLRNILNSLSVSDSLYCRIIKRPEICIPKQELPFRYYFNYLIPQFSSKRLMKST